MDDNTLTFLKVLVAGILIIGSYIINPDIVPWVLALLGGVVIPTTKITAPIKPALDKLIPTQ